MTAQDLQSEGGTRAAAGAAFEEDLDRQEAIFEERADELLARHPDKFIAVCGGEVFVGDDDGEAIAKARAAHPGRPFFLRVHDPLFTVPQGHVTVKPAGPAPGAAFEEDLDRQEAIFEERADELLARHPDKFIAVCGGEVFVGDDDGEAIAKARAAHPGRPFFLRVHDPRRGCLQ